MPDTTTLPLRDIHLPADISWWPPAPGWWISAGLFLSVVLLALWLHRHTQNRQLHKAAAQELTRIQTSYEQQQNEQQLVQSLSIWLRRVCINYYPAVDVAGLTGCDWLQFLDKNLSKSSAPKAFSEGPGRLLLSAPYQASVPTNSDELLLLCQTWLKALPMQHRKSP